MINKWLITGLGLILGYSFLRGNNTQSTNTNPPTEPEPNTPNTINLNQSFKNAISKRFGSLSSTQKTSIDNIVNSWNLYGDGDLNKLAYIFATAYWESKIQPIKERRAKEGTSLYDLQKRYWLSGYYGRGFVQLTWESNYKKMGDFLGIDLVGNPDLALNNFFAAQILVFGMMNGSFTRKSLRDYISPNSQDFFNARKTVNGLDKASTIESYTFDIINNLDFIV